MDDVDGKYFWLFGVPQFTRHSNIHRIRIFIVFYAVGYYEDYMGKNPERGLDEIPTRREDSVNVRYYYYQNARYTSKRESPSHFLWSLTTQDRNKSLNSILQPPTQQWCYRMHQKPIKGVFCIDIARLICKALPYMLSSMTGATILQGFQRSPRLLHLITEKSENQRGQRTPPRSPTC